MEEYEKATGSDSYRYVADVAARSLSQYLGKGDCDAQTDEYANQSWAYLRLYNYYKFTGDSRSADALRDRIGDCDIGKIGLDRDHQPGFFSVYGNYLHLLQQTGLNEKLQALLMARPISDEQLQPINTLRGAHHLSINYARAWALWSVFLATGEPRYQAAYGAHLERNYGLHHSTKDDYHRYGHWVPQFGIYAMTAPYADKLQDFRVEVDDLLSHKGVGRAPK